jgi:arginine decarboxylase
VKPAAVNIELTAEGGYRLVEPRHGDTVEELLRYVEFDPAQLLTCNRDKIAAAGLRGRGASRVSAPRGSEPVSLKARSDDNPPSRS